MRPAPPAVTLPIRILEDRLSCPMCGERVSLHQPDLDMPDRLLAICGACDAWAFLVEMPDGDKTLALPLPGREDLIGRWAGPDPD